MASSRRSEWGCTGSLASCWEKTLIAFESAPLKLLPRNGYNSYFPLPFQKFVPNHAA